MNLYHYYNKRVVCLYQEQTVNDAPSLSESAVRHDKWRNDDGSGDPTC